MAPWSLLNCGTESEGRIKEIGMDNRFVLFVFILVWNFIFYL